MYPRVVNNSSSTKKIVCKMFVCVKQALSKSYYIWFVLRACVYFSTFRLYIYRLCTRATITRTIWLSTHVFYVSLISSPFCRFHLRWIKSSFLFDAFNDACVVRSCLSFTARNKSNALNGALNRNYNTYIQLNYAERNSARSWKKNETSAVR